MAHWPFGRGSSRQTVSEARVDGRQGRGSSPRSRSLQVKSHHKDATGMEGMAVEGEGQGQAWGTLAPGGIRMAEGILVGGGIQLGRFWWRQKAEGEEGSTGVYLQPNLTNFEVNKWCFTKEGVGSAGVPYILNNNFKKDSSFNQDGRMSFVIKKAPTEVGGGGYWKAFRLNGIVCFHHGGDIDCKVLKTDLEDFAQFKNIFWG